ncbi:MAG: hypothetical protein HY963_02905 [Ignavibacteriales bacterium]|nr:hypothetical protein [Ignavibacteriales bacterium]
MKKIIVVVVILLLTACSSKKNISDVLQNKYEIRTISNNFSIPAIDLEKDYLKEILLLLHYNFTAEKIKEYFNMNDSVYNLRINDLFGEGLIKKTSDGDFIPTCMIIDADEGKVIKNTADSLGREMSGIVIDRIGKIKEAYAKIPAFKKIPFENASLFILGNVLHNYWQMKFVEERYLKSFPPQRGSSRYYLALLQSQNGNNSEPFGLFNNRFKKVGSYTINLYGNKFSGELPSYTEKELYNLFRTKNSTLLLVKESDQKKIEELALIITQDLLNYLERNRQLFVKLYLNSVYKDQTSFREWFIWFYQFIITQTNKTLMEKGFIKKFSSGSVEVILEK